MENLLKLNVLDSQLYQQLQCLKAVEQRYDAYGMRKISKESKFSDSIWKFEGIEQPDFIWNNYFSENQYPLMILLKVVMFHQIELNNRAVSMITSIPEFMFKFGNMLESKQLLTINTNSSIKGLSHLRKEDITQVVSCFIQEKQKLFNHPALSLLAKLKDIPFNSIKEAPFLYSNFELPWGKTEVVKWIKNISEQLGYYHVTNPYPAISFSQISEIVKNAEPWVTDKRMSVITKIFDLVRNNQDKNSKREMNSNKPQINTFISKAITKNYGSYFKSFLPLEFDTKGKIKMSWLNDLFKLARSAATQIILLTTGIRNVDLRNLQVECCVPSKRSDLLYYLVLNIKKTKLKNFVIPVPLITYKATKLLEAIRWDESSEFLINRLQATNQGKDRKAGQEWAIADGKVTGGIIRYFFDYYSINLVIDEDKDFEATAHCYRATLAGWIGSHSKFAILILKKLFGHSNGLMPDAYLKNNPIVIKKRKEIIKESTFKTVEQITNAIVNDQIAGGKAESLKTGIEELKKDINQSHSLTEAELNLTLKEQFKGLLYDRIQSGQMNALLTPMSVICMRNANDTTESPCSHDKYRRMRSDSGFSKAYSEVLGTLPDLANCIGNKCKDSLMGDWSLPLYEAYLFYKQLLLGLENSFDEEQTAKIFIKQYAKDIKEVFGDIEVELANG